MLKCLPAYEYKRITCWLSRAGYHEHRTTHVGWIRSCESLPRTFAPSTVMLHRLVNLWRLLLLSSSHCLLLFARPKAAAPYFSFEFTELARVVRLLRCFSQAFSVTLHAMQSTTRMGTSIQRQTAMFVTLPSISLRLLSSTKGRLRTAFIHVSSVHVNSG